MSKRFVLMLARELSPKTGKPLRATSTNRVLATLRTFARYVERERPFLCGMPLAGMKSRPVDAPAWCALTDDQVARLRLACRQRQDLCKRGDQRVRLEAAVFLLLLNTGMREHELVGLDLHQYHDRALHQVKRKGAKVTTRIEVPREAREAVDAYIANERDAVPFVLDHRAGKDVGGPLFVSRRGGRLTVRAVAYICDRLATQASANAPESERFSLTPHQLRHTFLRRVADKHGVHFAQELSGNVSMREIYRYTKPSEEDMAQAVEGLF